ncbi:osiris 8 [Sergentomyia squamirostris]
MFSKCLLVLCSVTLVLGRSAPTSKNTVTMEDKARSLVGSSVFNDLRYIYRTYQECSSTDLTVCLKIKLLTSLDRASRSLGNVSIGDDIRLVRPEADSVDETPVKSNEEIEESLPRSLSDKQTTLNKMIFNKIIGFFNTHTLQVKFPESEDVSRSMNEGRGKEKKNNWMMIPVILAGSMVPLAYGALALLAGKALIVSKLALVLASIIGIKKLVSSSAGHHEGAHEVVVSGGHGGSGWGRSLDSHDQAFRGQKPNQ